jgi:intracellular septation protein
MNQLIDLLPLAAFGGTWVFSNIYTATAVLMAGCVILAGYRWISTGRFPKMHVATAVMACVFGALTLYYRNPEFIKLKFSLVYLLIGAMMLSSHFFSDKVLIQRIPQDALKMPDAAWRRMSLAWIVYFIALAGVNWYIAENFSEKVWFSFKFLAGTVLPVVFMLAQAPFLAPYLEPDPKNDHAR